MLNELQPLGLVDTAVRLGTDPFEVVRLLVATESVPLGPFQLDLETCEKLRVQGRIDPPWWEGVKLPKDSNPHRARIRAAMQLMVDKGRVGSEQTRMDNVWRGLPGDDQLLLQRALMALAGEGVLRMIATAVGLMVSIEPTQLDTALKVASGKHESAGLQAALAEAAG